MMVKLFSHKKHLLFVFFLLIVFFCFLPVANQLKISVVLFFTIFLWATALLPEWLSAFFFLTICCVAKLAPVDIVLSGFMSSAAWLVISGIIISAAIVHSGLGYSVASSIYPLFIGSSRKAIAVSVLFGLLVSFIMPSAMNRIILLLPLLDSVAIKLGYQPENKGYKGIVIGGVIGTYLPATTILPSNVPNNVLAGLIESIYHTTLTYTDYLLLHFPVLGALKTVLIILLLWVLYPDKATVRTTNEKRSMSAIEKRLGLILLLAMLLWVTEPYHHISVAWVSMLVAVICLYPGFDFMADKPLSKVNLSSFFYVSAIVSLGAVAYYSGVARYMAAYLFDIFSLKYQSFNSNFFVLASLSTTVSLIVTAPGVPGVLTPMSDQISHMTALPVNLVYMLQVLGFSTTFFVYQAPPLVMAVQSGKINLLELNKVLIIIAALTVVILWPLDILWWHLITDIAPVK